MSLPIACIVEGHGEVEAVPILIRRIAADLDPALVVDIAKPAVRVPRMRLVRAGELERYVELAVRKTDGRGAVLILIDSEDNCPARLGPELLQRARVVRGNIPMAVVLAKYEYEAWFLAAADSLRGIRGLASDLTRPPDPEAIRGAKEWLSHRMISAKYSEVLHQPALTARVDLAKARSADSFDRCHREVVRLLNELRGRLASP